MAVVDRYSGLAVLEDEHLIMSIAVEFSRSKHSGELDLHVKQVL